MSQFLILRQNAAAILSLHALCKSAHTCRSVCGIELGPEGVALRSSTDTCGEKGVGGVAAGRGAGVGADVSVRARAESGNGDLRMKAEHRQWQGLANRKCNMTA